MTTFVPINNIKPYNSYTASDGETSFVFDWFVLKAIYLTVYKNDVLLTLYTDYTVPTGSVGSATGGNIVLSSPCVVGDRIVILRESDIERTSGYTESGDFRSSAVNLDLNYIISLIQELSFKTGRGIILSPSDADTIAENMVLPKLSDRIGKYLAFDNLGNLVAVESSSIDLYYNWEKITGNATIEKTTKKAYLQITSSATILLPVMGVADDGREIFMLNISDSTENATISANSSTVTVDGNPNVVLIPGEYKRFIYNHSLLKWFTVD